MQTSFLFAASASSFVTFLVHTFAGGRVVARPLLADASLPRAAKWLAYYCWHIATVLLLGMALAFAWCAMLPGGEALAAAATLLAAALSPLSMVVALKGGINPIRFPSTSLFAVTAILGAAAFIV